MSQPRGRSRHRATAPAPVELGNLVADPELVSDGDLSSYLASLAPDAHADATELTGRFGSAQVFQLRLPALRIEQLRRIAQERGVSPGALAVDWVIDRLDREDTPTGPLPLIEADEPKRRSLRERLGRR
ncbi:hypothetical protein [Pseudonocardia sp. GCM10023141]|uniref:hypothetical protein n=1 Tax=Pseudonocardia sp. GCM10023141 TaxID=3252653 RepID=UPI00360CB60E